MFRKATYLGGLFLFKLNKYIIMKSRVDLRLIIPLITSFLIGSLWQKDHSAVQSITKEVFYMRTWHSTIIWHNSCCTK